MEQTLVILKPCTLQRGLVWFENNQTFLNGKVWGLCRYWKWFQLTDDILSEHYSTSYSTKSFFQRVKRFNDDCSCVIVLLLWRCGC